jgi:SAM-dependent methyltransferase
VTEPSPEFDQYAAEYDKALAQGISISGEDKSYFAEGRVKILRGCLADESAAPGVVLDFGCGTGQATPFLLSGLGASRVIGVDISEGQLDVARRDFGSARASFQQLQEFRPAGEIDIAFCNGVFHHIPVGERAAMAGYVFRSLRPGGMFALWENNPWNPATHIVMRRIPFDRNAIMLSAPEARRLLRAAGFDIVSVRFAFVFPRALRWLRPIEPLVAGVPLGTQYQVLARKPR